MAKDLLFCLDSCYSLQFKGELIFDKFYTDVTLVSSGFADGIAICGALMLCGFILCAFFDTEFNLRGILF